MCASTNHIAHAAIGRIGRPAFPAPSVPGGQGLGITRALSRREKADTRLFRYLESIADPAAAAFHLVPRQRATMPVPINDAAVKRSLPEVAAYKASEACGQFRTMA